ncbi:hypothetical protein [Flagellimonas marina]|uniref:WD40-like Beta Propeller Repeat n=1 Tax=Flagellimonas marina TaxID=1775168 RepID=A0ABV8PL38_9FLAO
MKSVKKKNAVNVRRKDEMRFFRQIFHCIALLTILAFLPMVLEGCATQRAIRLRNKSINAWEPKQHNAQQKAQIKTLKPDEKEDVSGEQTVEETYFGLKAPGLIPELFAPGIVSTDHFEVEGTFSSNIKEFYFLRQRAGEKPKNLFVAYKDGKWVGPQEIETSSEGEVFISSDNKKMYLGNAYRERTDEGWSEMISLGPPFQDMNIMRLTVSSTDTYVFDERDEIGTLRYSRVVHGKRQRPIPFGVHINSGKWTAHPFIAPDESYLIWDSERKGGFGGADLYISFRQSDDSWGPAVNLGEHINTEHDDIYGSVTADGKYFVFQRIDMNETNPSANIYWVSAKVIENLNGKNNK